MELLKKKIKIKDIYLILVIVLGLVTISLYSTYALFTGSVVSTENIANVSTDINIDFDINSSKTFNLDPSTIVYFNANIKNNMTGSIYYELYHNLDLASHPKVTIGEVVSDPAVTTTAPNTSGTLEAGSRKTVPIIIENNSSEVVTVNIGLAVGYVGNKIEYGTSNYPSGVSLITGVYDDDNVPSESCASSGPSVGEGCEVKNEVVIFNGVSQLVKTIRCPITDGDLENSGANPPELIDSLIPIKWNGDQVVKADANNPSNNIWYDYNSKLWANAVLVNGSSRSTYINASVGTPINEGDILGYFVWIPRYKYTIFNQNYKNGTVSPQEIKITFEEGLSKTGSITCSTDIYGTETCIDQIYGSIQNGVSTYTHPSFTFGDKELKGVWVSKFRTTGSATSPTVKPGLAPFKQNNFSSHIKPNTLFSSQTYLNSEDVSKIDSHMAKNIDWGMVAYLSHSKYGKNSEVEYSSASNTGGGTGTSYLSNKNLSTTGNIYGIYDMTLSNLEIVAAEQRRGTISTTAIAFNGYDQKYYDAYYYAEKDDDYTRTHLGDATGETRNWYSDAGYFVYYNSGFSSPSRFYFSRGGAYMVMNVDYVGTFAFMGIPADYTSFNSRAVLTFN